MDEELTIDEHRNDGGYRTEDGRCLRTYEVGAAELHDDGERAHKEGDGDILHDFCLIRHHQNEEWCDIEHERQL